VSPCRIRKRVVIRCGSIRRVAGRGSPLVV
jgi:hypothetical protein